MSIDGTLGKHGKLYKLYGLTVKCLDCGWDPLIWNYASSIVSCPHCGKKGSYALYEGTYYNLYYKALKDDNILPKTAVNSDQTEQYKDDVPNNAILDWCSTCGSTVWLDSSGTWHHVQHPAGHNALASADYGGTQENTEHHHSGLRTWHDLTVYLEGTQNKTKRLLNFIDEAKQVEAPSDLTVACHTFYALEALAQDETERGLTSTAARDGLVRYAARIARAFELYLRMTTGGELRYSREIDFHKPEVLTGTLAHYVERAQSQDRHAAWLTWLGSYDKRSAALYKRVADVFLDEGWNKSPSAGGTAWGQAARLVSDYIKGSMDDRSFVNMCWNLQHNHDFIFDKVWSVEGLGHTLVKQSIATNLLYDGEFISCAEPWVIDLWKTRTWGGLYRDRRPSWHGTGD